MAKILAFDASTEICSAALLYGDEISEKVSNEPRSHAHCLLPMAHELLQAAECSLGEVDAIAFGAGPGSFTGLRICSGIVQGLAFGADLPVVPVSSLQAMAWQARQQFPRINQCVTAIDARMNEVYWAVYRLDGEQPETLVAPEVSPVDLADARLRDWLQSTECAAGCIGVGTGCPLLSTMQGLDGCHAQWWPRAAAVAHLGKIFWQQGLSVDAMKAEPVYLRNEVSWKKRTRIRSRGENM